MSIYKAFNKIFISLIDDCILVFPEDPNFKNYRKGAKILDQFNTLKPAQVYKKYSSMYRQYIDTKNEDFFLNNTRFLFIFFSILNFLTYKTALSRSDGTHIKAASYFSIILFIIIFLYFVLYYLSKTNFFQNNLKKINALIVVLVILFFTNENISIKNIYDFPNNINNFISMNDNRYIKEEYTKSLIKLKKLLNENDCVQAFSHDQAIYYLLMH